MQASVEERLLAGVDSEEDRARLQVLLAHQRGVERARQAEDQIKAFAHLFDGISAERRRMKRSADHQSIVTMLLYILCGLLGLGVYLLYRQVIVSP